MLRPVSFWRTPNVSSRIVSCSLPTRLRWTFSCKLRDLSVFCCRFLPSKDAAVTEVNFQANEIATTNWECYGIGHIKAKFHYASWFEAGRLRTSFEPDSVMEFGFKVVSLYSVYTIQKVVKQVVQPVWQPAVSCKQTSNRLSNGLDNRLNVCIHDTTDCQHVVSCKRGFRRNHGFPQAIHGRHCLDGYR